MNRTFDSNGPDVKIRGSAAQIFDKYQALARDAQSSGDRVTAENYLQHAEHYYRILAALQAQASANAEQRNAQNGGPRQHGNGAEANGHAPNGAPAPQGEDTASEEAPASPAPASAPAAAEAAADDAPQPQPQPRPRRGRRSSPPSEEAEGPAAS